MQNAMHAGENDPLRSLQAGAVVDGKYRVDQIIGRGGMGIVVAATHLELNERVALKFLHARETEEATPEDFRARFALEARVCAKLRNEHIARVRDVGVWRGAVPYMVMEYLVGVDLRRRLRTEKKLPLERAVSYVVQICEGLAEAHAQGIIHRDLKPPNVFITERAEGGELLKVLDFGISKWTSGDAGSELTKAGTMLGSPKYMSPEQLSGSPVDGRADIWSIGAMLYEMLAGRPPFDFPNVMQTFVAVATGTPPPLPSTFEPTIPPAVDAVILRCLTHDRDRRTANVAELAGAILEAVESPFAAETRAQLEAILDPSFVPRDRTSAIPTSLSTGSFAAYAFGKTEATPAPVTSPRPAPSAPPELLGWRRPIVKRGIVASGAAIALAVIALAGARAGATATQRAGSTALRAKSVTIKALAHERGTTLVNLEESAPPQSSARSRVEREAPARPVEIPDKPPAPLPRLVAAASPATAAVNPLSDRQ